jgi:hypothetical protein
MNFALEGAVSDFHKVVSTFGRARKRLPMATDDQYATLDDNFDFFAKNACELHRDDDFCACFVDVDGRLHVERAEVRAGRLMAKQHLGNMIEALVDARIGFCKGMRSMPGHEVFRLELLRDLDDHLHLDSDIHR